MRKLLHIRSKEPNPKSEAQASSNAGSSSSVPGKVFSLGIKTFYEPALAVADIVFVHGLTGDREKTWTAAGAVDPWPKGLLPKEIPHSRILTFGYDAYVSDWRGMVSKNRVGDHSKNLLAALATYREKDDTNNRPILFVSHSLGGLVCQDALQESRNSAESHLQKILECTCGIVFLGTPHSGSGFAIWAEILAKSVGLIKQTNPQIVQTLREDSEVLARIQSGFHTMIRARADQQTHRSLKITCFFEELPLIGIGEVVPKHSAILPGYTSIGIHENHIGMTKFEIEDDPGYVSVVGELRRWVKELKLEPVTAVNPSQAKFLVPFDRDPHFVGREEIIAQVDNRLHIRSRVSLTGIGGVGKSQIAIEYCYRFREKYPEAHIFWVNAGSFAKFEQSYTEIARRLDISRWENPKTDTLQLLFEWLANNHNGRWLMVVDNADDDELFFGKKPYKSSTGAEQPRPLFSYLPKSSRGSMLATSRDMRLSQNLMDGDIPIKVLQLDMEEAEKLLYSQLPQDYISDKLSTTIILQKLDGLPLAITQATAFIKQNSITTADYIDILQTSDTDLIDLLSEDHLDPRRNLDAPNSVVQTWKISFDQIQRQNPRAAELLSLMAVLDRQGIPQSLLRKESERKTEFLVAIKKLEAFSLIKAENGQEVFVIHRLVQLATRNWLALQQSSEMFETEALRVLSSKFPFAEYQNWKTCKALLPHAQVVLSYTLRSDSALLHRADLLDAVSRYQSEQGQHKSSYRNLLEVVNINEKLRDENDIKTLCTQSALANTLACLNRPKEAMSKYQEVLIKSKESLGDEHPSTSMIIVNLAGTLADQRQFEEAESLYRRVLMVYENTLGEENPQTLCCKDNLALVLAKQNQYKGAEVICRHVLALKNERLGEKHPQTLMTLAILGWVLLKQNQHEEAEAIGRKVLRLTEEVLGEEHPDTLPALRVFLATLVAKNQYEEAILPCQQLLIKMEKARGKDHPDTLFIMLTLAWMLVELNQHEKGIAVYQQLLATREKALGKDHPDTLDRLALLDQALAIFDQFQRMSEPPPTPLNQFLLTFF